MTEQIERKTTLLNDETFNLLRSAQRIIQDETEFSPTLRLLINDVINDDSVNKATERLINKIKASPLFSNNLEHAKQNEEDVTTNL